LSRRVVASELGRCILLPFGRHFAAIRWNSRAAVIEATGTDLDIAVDAGELLGLIFVET